MTAPRLVHVTTTDISLELLLGPQLRAFRDAGYDVVTMSAPGPYVSGLEASGIAHVPLRHATRSMAPHRDGLALAELYRRFRELRPAIVHTHNPKPGVYGRLAARAARVPVVVNTVHGLYAQPTDRLARRAAVYGLERVAAACSDAELVQNPEDLPVLARLRIPGERLHLLGNGVDLGRFRRGPEAAAARHRIRTELGVTADQLLVGAVGRLVWEKGYREVFQAAARLAHRDDVVFIVVGSRDAAKADAVDDAAIRAAEADGIRFLGERLDVESIYPAMDVYVLASYREGFPRSAMEASAMGVPVVATDIRGCRQVVEEGLTGLLVPARDTNALAAAITELADQPDLRRSMGAAAAVKAAADFDQQSVIDLTLATYARLLGD